MQYLFQRKLRDKLLGYSDSYTLNDIEFCLKNVDVLEQRAEETGNMADTIDLIADTETCLSKADLTANQSVVLQLRWRYHFTLKECGLMLGVSLEAVRQSEELAKNKLQKVLDVWNRKEVCK